MGRASGRERAKATVEVTVSPTKGVGSVTEGATARSACVGVALWWLVLIVGSGSNWSECEIVAVLTSAPALVTRATIWSETTLAPGRWNLGGRVWATTVPTAQMPVVWS